MQPHLSIISCTNQSQKIADALKQMAKYSKISCCSGLLGLLTSFDNVEEIMNSESHKIDSTTLDALLYLSRLSPESTNMEVLKSQVDQIVEYFDILSAYNDNENPYDAYPSTTADALREDKVVAGLEMKDVKKITPEFLDGYFRVPKVLGGGA